MARRRAAGCGRPHQQEARVAARKVLQRVHDRQQRQVLQRVAAQDELVAAGERPLRAREVLPASGHRLARHAACGARLDTGCVTAAHSSESVFCRAVDCHLPRPSVHDSVPAVSVSELLVRVRPRRVTACHGVRVRAALARCVMSRSMKLQSGSCVKRFWLSSTTSRTMSRPRYLQARAP